MVFICKKTNNCKNLGDLINLAHRQMEHLNHLHNCFSYGISSQLLIDPYGPQEESELPKLCKKVFTKAANLNNQSEHKLASRQCNSEMEN